MALVQVVTFSSSSSEAEGIQNTRDTALLRPTRLYNFKENLQTGSGWVFSTKSLTV